MQSILALLVPTLNRSFDNLLSLLGIEETLYMSRARFLEILVVVEVEFDLLEPALWQIFESLNGIAIVAIVIDNRDNLVVNFPVVLELHYAENTSSEVNTGRKWLIGHNEHIELIAVLIERLWDEAVVARLCKCDWLNAVEHKASALAVPFNLMIATGWDFDNNINRTFFIISWVKNLIKIGHFFPFFYSICSPYYITHLMI